MHPIFAFVSGLIFALGLFISGMGNPSKVLAFLDLAGIWDPSLAFVMGGAILIGMPVFYLAKKRGQTYLGEPLRLPHRTDIDKPLCIGAALFGMGWGLAGICPGPALLLAGMFSFKGLVFLLCVLLGMWLFEKMPPQKMA